MPKRLTTEDFIQKARKVHGDKYDYSKVVYKNDYTKVIIICSIHGEFQQRPSSHLSGCGCRKCGFISGHSLLSKTTEEFIEKARKVHGDKYDYSKVVYRGMRDKVIIICPEHGEFLQKADSHVSGRHGCPGCKAEKIRGNRRFTREEFIEKARKVHGDKYDYSKVVYNTMGSKVTIICPEHGEFEQLPYNHVHGFGCFLCSSSKEEKYIWKFLKDSNISFECQKKFDGCRYKQSLFFDFYLPDYNMCIEFDGEFHLESTLKRYYIPSSERVIRKSRDEIKTQYCKENNIKLLRISYEDQDRIEEILKKELNLC